MSALLRPRGTRLEPISGLDLDTLLAIENAAYPIPWTRGNFIDALAAGYLARKLLTAEGSWIGYFVAMAGVDEMHLLNLTVAPPFQRQGFGRALLDAVVDSARAHAAHKLLLEVRIGNSAAQALYRGYGFDPVGVRKGYYPAAAGAREDALVLALTLPRTCR
jgi:ribosomal-protein-alanine N-acetyltransferase